MFVEKGGPTTTKESLWISYGFTGTFSTSRSDGYKLKTKVMKIDVRTHGVKRVNILSLLWFWMSFPTTFLIYLIINLLQILPWTVDYSCLQNPFMKISRNKDTRRHPGVRTR